MTTDYPTAKGLRAAIIGQTKRFLTGLETGVSDELLTSILVDIEENKGIIDTTGF